MIASSYLVPGVANAVTPIASSFTPAAWVIVQARSANTGNIRIGDRTITSTTGGTVLTPGNSLIIPYKGGPGGYDLRQIFVLATNTTDGVDINYGQ